MAAAPLAKRLLYLRLIHNGMQPGTPVPEPVRFGLQDSKGEVHSGVMRPDGSQQFDFSLEIKGGSDADRPVFGGAFAHGPPTARFLYLSWKRERKHDAPWAWRLKVPLSGIGAAEIRAAGKPGACFEADVNGRRPHKVEAVQWRVGALGGT
jgi:hypothetical protein